ncbi:MAG TPA: riboflavin biosynthesis protein RibF [Opitutaceae bacterium]|nr:riboflavin biosynthesis protein RibF [Opitutaceae bacterium]
MSAPLHFTDLAAAASLPPRPVHLAIGMFDGVHLGHQSVIESAVHSARRCAGLAGVLTFWPHPARILRPGTPVPLIHDRDTKRRVLARLGLDFIVEQEFTAAYSAMEAAGFVPWLKGCLPHLAAVYVGENWRFGRGRSGDVALLVREGKKAGIEVYSAPRLNHNGAPVSSSRIRELLARGAVTEANALLGYSYFAEGMVQPGRKLGRELGFPTLNIPWEPDLKPAYGVYAVSVVDASGQTRLGVANYGLRPTVANTTRPLLEVHLLGESTHAPGDALTIHWLQYLRPEQRFPDLAALRAQIAQDRQRALEFFARVAGD